MIRATADTTRFSAKSCRKLAISFLDLTREIARDLPMFSAEKGCICILTPADFGIWAPP